MASPALVQTCITRVPRGAKPSSVAAGDGRERLEHSVRACHSLDAIMNKPGPGLDGTFDRPPASVRGFLHSPAMRRAKIIWRAEFLNAYLESPQSGVFKAHEMPFAGLRSAGDRANLIAYIQKTSK